MIYKFDCVEINDDLDLFQIKQGTLGTFKINDIKNIKIAYEQADFKGKTKPFLHQYIGGASFFTAMEPVSYTHLTLPTT